MADLRSFFETHAARLQAADVYRPRPNPTLANPPWETAGWRVLIVRLSPWRDAQRSLPHLVLAQAARRAGLDVYVDFAFFPPEHDRNRFDAAGIPWLVGCQSFREAREFDVVLISNAYTLELLNLPALFLHSNIPLRVSRRDASWPPLLLGGSNATAAQAAIAPDGDSWADAIFFGEGETEVLPILRALREHAARPRRERLLRAADLAQGLWVAGQPPERRVRQAVAAAPAIGDLPLDVPVLNGDEADVGRIPVNFGCPAFCSFCFEGYDRKPYRELSNADLLTAALRLKARTGCRQLELYSFNVNTLPRLPELLLALHGAFDRVGFKSQRVDLLHAVPNLLDAEIAAGKSQFTLGIEGLSDRLRAYLHKSLSAGEILALLDRLLRSPVRELKLFYLLTGLETRADLEEFRNFIRDLRALHQRHRPTARIIVSAGYLVRMPGTPLQYDRLRLDPADFAAARGAAAACRAAGFEFRLAAPWEDYAVTQVLALGGHELCDALEMLAREGICFDGELPPAAWPRLKRWMQDQRLWTETFLGEKPADYPFPLPWLERPVARAFLRRQYEQSMDEEDEGYCLGGPGRPGECLGCAACSPEQRAAITAARAADTEPVAAALRNLVSAKARLTPLYVRVRLPEAWAGAQPAWIGAAALRGLLGVEPAWAETLWSADEALFTHRDLRDRFPLPVGETVLALRAREPERLAANLQRRGAFSAGSLVFQGLENRFQPGAFESAELSFDLPPALAPDARARFEAHLKALPVAFQMRRDGDARRYDVPPRELRRRTLFAARVEEKEDATRFHLKIGPKFDLLGFLRSLPDHDAERMTRVTAGRLNLGSPA